MLLMQQWRHLRTTAAYATWTKKWDTPFTPTNHINVTNLHHHQVCAYGLQWWFLMEANTVTINGHHQMYSHWLDQQSSPIVKSDHCAYMQLSKMTTFVEMVMSTYAYCWKSNVYSDRRVSGITLHGFILNFKIGYGALAGCAALPFFSSSLSFFTQSHARIHANQRHPFHCAESSWAVWIRYTKHQHHIFFLLSLWICSLTNNLLCHATIRSHKGSLVS